jgi:hypothetical protein
VKICHRCGHEVQLLSELQPAFNNQCREPQAEWCPDKEKANFCEFFEFRETSALTQPGMGGAQSSHDRARAALDSLFKKKT